MISNEKAWARMGGRPEETPILPFWAHVWAEYLPRTTARMLELDSLHRQGDHLDLRLNGLLRWHAADAVGCEYGRRVAVADLSRTGVANDELALGTARPHELDPAEQSAVKFVRKMMRHAFAVSDGEVAQLCEFFGDERVVAIVQLVAHASFQNRVFLAAGLQAPMDEPAPPIEVRLPSDEPNPAASGPPADESRETIRAEGAPPTADGDEASWRELQTHIASQRTCTGRIRVPSKTEFYNRIGTNHPAAWQADIVWSRVCYGHQPKLTDAWFVAPATFRQESLLDRLFEQEIFWVVTRALNCFY